jgi:hypothetical protein
MSEIKATRRNGMIVIEIPENTVIYAAENNPDYQNAKVFNREDFLDFVTNRIVQEVGYEADTGLSGFYRLLDDASLEALESYEGIEIQESV